jgi:hypothetical protein
MNFVVAVGALSETFPGTGKSGTGLVLDPRRKQGRRGADTRPWELSKRKWGRATILDNVKGETTRFQRHGHLSNPYPSTRPSIQRKTTKAQRLVNGQIVAASSSRVDPARGCNPLLNVPDIGILSCGPDFECEPNQDSVSGGICVPSRSPLDQDDLKLTRTSWCDPYSSDPDVGILSCGNGRNCQPSKTSPRGGKCNKLGDVATIECVPTSSSSPEADIGILVCGSGQICVDSEESHLGGLCITPNTTTTGTTTPTTSGRHLQQDGLMATVDCQLCDFGFVIPDGGRGNNALMSLAGWGDSLTCTQLVQANMDGELSAQTCSDASVVAMANCCVYKWYVRR